MIPQNILSFKTHRWSIKSNNQNTYTPP